MNTFPCPSCGGDVDDNGSYSCGYCSTCGIFFHAFQRHLPDYDPMNDPYGYVPHAFEPHTSVGDAISSSEP